MFSYSGRLIVLGMLYMSVFLPFIRAYIVDHPVVSIAPFMVVFSFLLLVYLQSSTYKIHADRYLFFLSLFAIHLFLFVLNFDGTETFILLLYAGNLPCGSSSAL